MNETTRIKITDIRTVGVPVTDQDRALAFYGDTLGLEKRLDVPFGDGRRWIEVGPAGGSTTIALVPATDTLPSGVETGIRLAAADAEVMHHTLRAAGGDTDDVLRWPGVPAMFAFRDPDGNGLEIVGDADSEPWGEGR